MTDIGFPFSSTSVPRMAGIGAQPPVRLVSASPSQPASVAGTTPLLRWDRLVAAVNGLAPQDVKAGGDNDRGTDGQAGSRHVPPHREAEDHCPYQRKVVERHHCRGWRQ